MVLTTAGWDSPQGNIFHMLAPLDQLELIKFLLTYPAAFFQHRFRDGRSPAHIAFMYDKVDNAMLFVKADPRMLKVQAKLLGRQPVKSGTVTLIFEAVLHANRHRTARFVCELVRLGADLKAEIVIQNHTERPWDLVHKDLKNLPDFLWMENSCVVPEELILKFNLGESKKDSVEKTVPAEAIQTAIISNVVDNSDGRQNAGNSFGSTAPIPVRHRAGSGSNIGSASVFASSMPLHTVQQPPTASAASAPGNPASGLSAVLRAVQQSPTTSAPSSAPTNHTVVSGNPPSGLSAVPMSPPAYEANNVL